MPPQLFPNNILLALLPKYLHQLKFWIMKILWFCGCPREIPFFTRPNPASTNCKAHLPLMRLWSHAYTVTESKLTPPDSPGYFPYKTAKEVNFIGYYFLKSALRLLSINILPLGLIPFRCNTNLPLHLFKAVFAFFFTLYCFR